MIFTTFKMHFNGNNMDKQVSSKWLIVLAFIAIYFVWGTTYLANLFALKGFPPFILSCFRYLMAGLLIGSWIIYKKLPLPSGKSIKVLCISGILMLVGGSGLIVWAEQYIDSGYAAVIVATEPLWFVVLDKKRWKQYFSNRLVLGGLILGFVGMILFASFAPVHSTGDGNTSHFIMGTVIVLISATLWVIGTLYSNKKLPPNGSNLSNTGIQLAAAGLFCGLIALGRGEWNRFALGNISPEAWGGLLYLTVFGSLVAFLAFTWLITVQPPAVVSTHTYVNPVVAIIMGWLLVDEQILPKQVIALVVAFTGVVLTQIGKNKFAKEI
jgi:drug/metabolite transporter (DMT)-like permease